MLAAGVPAPFVVKWRKFFLPCKIWHYFWWKWMFQKGFNTACKFVNIICFCIIISQMHLKYSFPQKSCVILNKFKHEIPSLRSHCKTNVWKSLMTSVVAIWQDLTTFFVKMNVSEDFCPKPLRRYRKRDTWECSRILNDIANFSHQTSL